MKKILFGIALVLLCSFTMKRIAFTPVWRLMLTSDLIVSGKVLSHDTTAIEIEVNKQLSINSKNNVIEGQKIKINHSNNSKYKIKASRIADGTKAVFFLNNDLNSENFNHTDRFSGIVPLSLDEKIQYFNGIDSKNYATLLEYYDAIRLVKKTYTIDKTGMVQSKWSKKCIYNKNKVTGIAKSIFDEIERERSTYSH